ncbi:MAG: hypothetical protein AAFR38_01410 [Planctomycetota bacterium]
MARINPKRLEIAARRVDQILWREWDPIDLKSFHGPDYLDEYHTQACEAAEIAWTRGERDVARYLNRARVCHMGMSQSDEAMDTDRRVAGLVFTLVQEIKRDRHGRFD